MTNVSEWRATPAGDEITTAGSPEFLILESVPATGISQDNLKKTKWGSGFAEAMKNKWIQIEKTENGAIIKRTVCWQESIFLSARNSKRHYTRTTFGASKRRRARPKNDHYFAKTQINYKNVFHRFYHVLYSQFVYYSIEKDFNFEKRQKFETELTEEMLRTYFFILHMLYSFVVVLLAEGRGTPSSSNLSTRMLSAARHKVVIVIHFPRSAMSSDRFSSRWGFFFFLFSL